MKEVITKDRFLLILKEMLAEQKLLLEEQDERLASLYKHIDIVVAERDKLVDLILYDKRELTKEELRGILYDHLIGLGFTDADLTNEDSDEDSEISKSWPAPAD